jgi:hypothetical protein
MTVSTGRGTLAEVELIAVELSSGRRIPCLVTASELPESCQIAVATGEDDVLHGRGCDVEEALQNLRVELESRNWHLLCNRYRRDAFVTSMSRQMSGGLGCYLVKPRRPVSHRQIVHCLEPAGEAMVVSAQEAETFIAEWRRARPGILIRLFWAWRIRLGK